MGYLRHALRYVRGGQTPWRGGELGRLSPNASAPLVDRYPWLDAFVAALKAQGAPTQGQVPLPVAIPHDMASLAHPPGMGTRMIFSIAGQRLWLHGYTLIGRVFVAWVCGGS